MDITLVMLLILGVLGAFDTFYYHEWKLRLPAHPEARKELKLHALRDFFYTIIFGSIAWLRWEGVLAFVFGAIFLTEIAITISDFIEEDGSRRLPPGERAMHTIMALLYGAFLARLTPELHAWSKLPTGFSITSHGLISLALTAFAIGVFLSGVRDLIASVKK